MTRLQTRRRAYLLVHVVTILPIAALLLLVLGRLLLDSLYVQRVAAEHARIVAAGADLLRQLRADALATTRWSLRGDVLRLEAVLPGGQTPIEYRLARDHVARVAASSAERHWSAPRLRFVWQLETGGAGSVLWVELNESPPARKTAVLVKRFRASVFLPAQSATAVAATEVEP